MFQENKKLTSLLSLRKASHSTQGAVLDSSRMTFSKESVFGSSSSSSSKCICRRITCQTIQMYLEVVLLSQHKYGKHSNDILTCFVLNFRTDMIVVILSYLILSVASLVICQKTRFDKYV